ncbi:HNH endonuclease [Patescibacteria group bacterium]|nr:HNH endonuclease [Patescibacteria group bacterium]
MPRATKRKSSTRQNFLKKRGLKKTPKGKQIDHKKSLSEGGSDSQKNLRLIKKSTHAKKTTAEARRRARRKK